MTRFTPRKVFWVFLLGVLLLQAAWILTIPAFRGSDEFDHVYKAAAVARGQWTAREAPAHGRGTIVAIPESIVRAASPVCNSYKYTGHDNCFPIRSVGHGNVEVATGAGTYNPAYYLVVGTLAKPFGGDAADYVMRAVSSLGCALLIAWAASITARWATTAWPLMTFVVGLTPVLVYSTTTAAPNGITYSSAAVVWASLVALIRSKDGRGLAVPLTAGSVALLATHTTGVMWLPIIFFVAVVLAPLRDWFGVLRRRPAVWIASAVIISTAIVLCTAWIRFANTNAIVSSPNFADTPFPWGNLPVFQVVWTLQAVAVFPLRNEPAPVPVYLLWGLPLLLLMVSLFRYGVRRERVAVTASLLILLVVPTVLTMLAYSTLGWGWQGRYSFPLWLGMTALAGGVLDRRRSEPTRSTVFVLFGLLAAAMTISTVHVDRNETLHGAIEPAAHGNVGALLVAALSVAGLLVLLAPLRPRATPASVAEDADIVETLS